MRDPRGVALAVALLGVIGTAMPPAAAAQDADLITIPSEMVTQLSAWVLRSADNRDLPFAIVDKTAAQVFVFGPYGDLRGATPALLGLAVGDDSTPGVGDRELSSIPPEDRTTPAGRFVSGFGRAMGGQNVFWVDYATAISLHPVVTTHPQERRLQRLRSPSADDNRITYGCINISAAFFDDVIRPTFSDTTGIVYVLPDTRPLEDVFPSFALQARATPPTPVGGLAP